MVRKRKKRLSRATVFGIILLTAVLCATLTYKQNTLKAQGKEYSSQLKELEKKQKELEQEEKDLEKLKDYVKSDEYAEEVARDKFGLVYEGEIIFEPEEK